MIRCVSYRNGMSVKVYKKDTEVLFHAIMFNCFQSREINESGGSFSDNYSW